MPTFQSIPIHPLVRSRLLHPQQQPNDGSSSSSHPNKSQQQHQHQHQHQHQQPIRSGVSIPRSLLTRDPNDLADLFSRGDMIMRNEQQRADILAQMEGIRCQVAHAMIAKTRNGKRVLCHTQQQQQQRNQQQQQDHQTLLTPLAQGGSMSVLHAWKLQQEILSKNHQNPQIYSTGCRALDHLIAFPAEYFFSPDDSNGSTTIPHDISIDINSGETKGLPRGYVLKISGTTGKTQLALQLVAQVVTTQSSQSPRNDEIIRYCYSTAGHSGHSLAQRLFQLIENSNNNREQRIRKDVAKKIEFQPIATVSQLISTIAKLEEEWLQQHTSASVSASASSRSCFDRDEEEEHQHQRPRQRQRQQQRGGARERSPVAMLVLDDLSLMLVERDDADRIRSLERWFKRLARHYSVLIVIVTTGVGGSSVNMNNNNNNNMAPDIHLQLQKLTSTTSSVQLLRHPAKSVTEKDCITLLHSSKFGMTTPE